MSLIIEFAFNSEFSPGNFHTGTQLPHGTLKPLQAQPYLGGKANALKIWENRRSLHPLARAIWLIESLLECRSNCLNANATAG